MTNPPRYRIRGKARLFYTGDDVLTLNGQEVTSTHRDAAKGHWTSAQAPPVPCRLADGTPCYVQPINLDPIC